MSRRRRIGLRVAALGWLSALLLFPVGMTAFRTFQHGLAPVIAALTTPEALHAAKLTVIAVAIAVPLNTAFGIVSALLLVRHRIPGRAVFSSLIDLPFAVSPIVLGLALFLLYGQNGWFGPWLSDHGMMVIFSVPGIILATVFVSLPFVVNELIPVLEEVGTEQEQAATTLGSSAAQTFRRITVPSIRWGLAYGIILTLARSLGEFGGVAVVSGRVVGETQTLTLYVQEAYGNFNPTGAYAAAFLLAFLAVAALVIMQIFRPKDEH